MRSIGTLAVVVLLVATGAAAPTVGTTARAGRPHPTRFAPGSSGIGDPYFPHEGNGGYDARHYSLRLSFDPDTHRLAGSSTVTAVATQNLSRFDLDLSGFTVSAVTIDGTAARFRRTGQELVVTPRHGIRRGSTFHARVSYAGRPRTVVGSPIVFGAPYGWIYTKDGAFVACEPNAAHTWYPSNDHPRDKATFRFTVTVPSDRRVVANGSYVGHRVSGDRATYVWAERQPMATYLATIDIGRWRFHRTRTPGGIAELVAVDPALATRARTRHTVRLTGRITDYWTTRFGAYPFASTGGIVDHVPDIGFSLETQTRPLYGFVSDQTTASHELSHEWFGDSVSVWSWPNIWLNEGFATFSSWLWQEHTGGPSTYRHAREIFRSVPRSDGFWHQSIAAPGRNSMFSGAVYYRGGMTLAALRHQVGDRAFFTILRTWVREHRHANATTGQFVRLAERVSGRPLDHFFQVWLYRQARPGQL
jgi:aminopeptidase N